MKTELNRQSWLASPAARKWAVAGAVLLTVLLALGLVLAILLPDNATLAARASTELEARLGVKTTVGSLHWQIFPTPAVVLENIVTEQAQPVKIVQLTAYPKLGPLWRHELVLSRLELDGATVPQVSLRGLGRGHDKSVQPAALASETSSAQGDLPLEHFVFTDVTWINRTGLAVLYEGEVEFGPQWRPRYARVKRPEVNPPATLTLRQLDLQDRWDAAVQVGGGTANGQVQLQTSPKGQLRLDGELEPKDVEVSSAVSAFNRRPVIGGKLSGKTTLHAEGESVAELGQSLHTRTLFSMGSATLLRFDLNKAVHSAGKEHDGQTPLDAVKGQLDTQNTPQGMVSRFTKVRASAGALTASGEATIANRQVQAEFAIDLVDGVVGIPLKLSGPVDAVQVSMPAGAMAGAAVGTVLLPGVGTAIGARLGATIGKLFRSEPTPEAKAGTAPGAPKRP